MEEANNVPIDKENKSIKWVLFVFVALLVLLIIFIAVVYIKGIGKGYFVYEGKGGKYRVDITKSGNMTDYFIHVTSNNHFYLYPFRNSPKDLEDIYLEPNIKDFIINKDRVYITQNVDEIGVKSLIGKIEFVKILGNREDLGGLYNLNIYSAFTTKEENLTVANCSDVSSSVGVVFLKLGEENKIYSDNECIIIEGKDDDGLLLSSEKFAYHLLEVF